MHKLREYATILWYLLVKDKKSYPTTRYIPATLISVLLLLWSYPLENLVPTGVLSPITAWRRRLYISIPLVIVALVAFFIHGYKRYKKYAKQVDLSDSELDSFLKYMHGEK